MVNKEIKIEEYRSLLEEHRKNRTYIFERPIIILGLVAFAMQYFFESIIGQFILAGLIFFLLFNLWFIGNRIRSDARIVAYIQLVHEGDVEIKHIGWENGLRLYRKWLNRHKRIGDIDKLRFEKFDSEAVPDRIVFYPGIWNLHLVIVLLIISIILLGWSSSKIAYSIVGMGAIGVALIIFLIFALGSYNPKRFKDSIELERATWLCVFEEFS